MLHPDDTLDSFTYLGAVYGAQFRYSPILSVYLIPHNKIPGTLNFFVRTLRFPKFSKYPVYLSIDSLFSWR
jgi:hypothetical protein